MTNLEMQFHKAMIDIYHRAKKECHYNAERYIQMVAEHGGLKTAQLLITKTQPSDGFLALYECGRPDLTVEALVLKDEYRVLFLDEELALATERLLLYNKS